MKKNVKKNRTQLVKGLRATRSGQKIIWGPAQYAFPLSPFPDSYMCLTKNLKDPKEITLIIRGTNPISANSWIWQDFLIDETFPWVINVAPPEAQISKATNLAMNIHRTKMIPRKKFPGEGKTIEEFILNLLKQKEHKITLNFTGHSLGGVMAVTMGLYFKDMLTYRYPELKDRYDIMVYSIAGPTAGNQAFADYTLKRLGNKLIRYVNPLDLAPKAWVRKEIESLPTHFGPENPPPDIFKFIHTKTMKVLNKMNYAQPGEAITVPSKVKKIKIYSPLGLPIFRKIKLPLPKGTNFLLQAAYQHVIPYVNIIYKNYPENESPIAYFKNHILKSINRTIPGKKLKKQFRIQIRRWFRQIEKNIHDH